MTDSQYLNPSELITFLGIQKFVTESNRIENIHREPTPEELDAHQKILDHPQPLSVQALEVFVATIQPGAVLRDRQGLDVRVGSHIPPKGGPDIATRLDELLKRIDLSAYERHCLYEELHPFLDGNGRSGRVVWLKDMGGVRSAPLGFLHHWYYQSLENSR